MDDKNKEIEEAFKRTKELLNKIRETLKGQDLTKVDSGTKKNFWVIRLLFALAKDPTVIQDIMEDFLMARDGAIHEKPEPLREEDLEPFLIVVKESNFFKKLLEEELKKREPKKFIKRSGHFVDNTLKKPLDLFSKAPKPKEENNLRMEIDLSSTDYKLIDTLLKTYYLQGYPPYITSTLYDLAKEYKGKNPSGKDITNMKKIIEELASKIFRVSFYITEKGVPLKRERIEQIIRVVFDTKEGAKNKTVHIGFHEVFLAQIESKFVKYPLSIGTDTVKAYGSPKPSGEVYKLRDYLLREKSSKRYTPQILESNLWQTISPLKLNQGRRALLKKAIDKALETVKKLGLLEKWEVVPSVAGERKYIFHINKNYC